MNKKTVLIFLAVFMALGLILFLKDRAGKTGGNRPFMDLQIKEMHINKKGTALKIHKKEGKWYVTDAMWPVDREKLSSIFKNIFAIELEDIISTREETYLDYKVAEDDLVTIRMISTDGTEYEFYPGKSSTDRTKSYLRMPGDPAVYIVGGLSRTVFDIEVSDWIDKYFISDDKDKIEKVNISFDGHQYEMDNSTSSFDNLARGIRKVKAIEYIESIEGFEGFLGDPDMTMKIGFTDKTERSYKVLKKDGEFFINPDEMDLIYKVKPVMVEYIKKFFTEKKHQK